MKEVLEDYCGSPAPARDSGVLNLFSVATTVLNTDLAPQIPSILASIFEPTLQMITKNMLDYPEHRINFFKFLRVANEQCFQALFGIQSEVVKLIIDSIVWAFKHTERNISETGLEILLELLQNLSRQPEVAQSFYQRYLLTLVQEIFSIMTDRLHKSGFRLQATLLMHILQTVALGQVTVPLFDSSSVPPGTDNAIFLKDFLSNILSNAFPNVTRRDIHAFVANLFNTSIGIEGYKQYVRDFLITCKEFATEDNNELYLEEHEAHAAMIAEEQEQYRRSVPGLGAIDDPDL
jgi:exportin-1